MATIRPPASPPSGPMSITWSAHLTTSKSSSTLSGGENQRVKLAYYLSQEKPHPTVFIFDEPTTSS